jgi:hypothetical protein
LSELSLPVALAGISAYHVTGRAAAEKQKVSDGKE